MSTTTDLNGILNRSSGKQQQEKATNYAPATLEEAELQGKIQFYKLRLCWSKFIMICISVLIIFQICLTGLIGGNILVYSNVLDRWFLPLVISENFIQIVGLGYVVAKFLYPYSKK